MAFEVVLPRLGWNMEEGSLACWRKQDGDAVSAGEILFEVEGDKAVQEVEAVDSGILHVPADSPRPGTVVPVGTFLAWLLGPGESPPARAPRPSAAGAAASPVAAAPRAPGSAAPAPPLTAARAPAPARAGARGPAISPRARRVAAEIGVDWRSLAGSGSTGRIVERDVRQAGAARPAGAPRAADLATFTTEADATELVRLAEGLEKEGRGAGPGCIDMIARIVAFALEDHPDLGPEGLPSASVTIVDLGPYDVDTFTPGIRHGQRAALGVGRIVARPVVIDAAAGTVAVRRMMHLCLAVDRGVVDDLRAARFLQAVKVSIEKPWTWLAGR